MAISLFLFSSILVSALSHLHHHHLHHHAFDTPPPPQDQCKPVDAREPPQCPQTIGPPCPPCYSNVLPDYKTGDDLSFNNATKQSMREFMEYYTNWWSENYPPIKAAGGFDIYSGSAGRALLFLRLYYYDRTNTLLLERAFEYIQRAISMLPTKQYYSAYMSSHVGVWSIKAIISIFQGNIDDYQKYVALIKNTYDNVNDAIKQKLNPSKDGINMTLLDMETGLTGMVYNGLFMDVVLGQEIIDTQILSNIAFYVMNQAISTGKRLNTTYLQIEFTFLAGCYLYGPNHGPTGLIHQFTQFYILYPDLMNKLYNSPKYYNAIKNTLDFYLSVQLPDGNMPTQIGGTCYQNYGNDSDARVQFCHGAPGFINVYIEAAYIFSKYNTTAAEIYFNAALVTANVTWERGLLVKGTMFCHGIAANINMLWELGEKIHFLQANADKSFLEQLENAGYDLDFLKNQTIWRAKQFVLWTLNWDNLNHTRIYDSNEGFSMFAGNYAIGMLYSQLVTTYSQFPDELPCHPGWDLCL